MAEARDRDEAGRARNARPRDSLGRPLPYGAVGVPRQPEGVRRTPAESLAEAGRLLRAGRPFEAHEVLEDAWKSAASDADRQRWRGLAQLAVGLTHAARGNVAGARSLLERGADNVAGLADLPAVVEWAHGVLGQLAATEFDPAEEGGHLADLLAPSGR